MILGPAMPRQTADQPITTRAARERLVVRSEPYWRNIDAGVSLGYRRGGAGGTWLVRTLVEGRYRETSLGRADDVIKADGVTYLEVRQAEAKARAQASHHHHVAAGLDPMRDGRAPYTVADAMQDYLRNYQRRGGKDVRGMGSNTRAHILPHLGEVRLDRLTRRRVTDWHQDLAAASPRLRTRAGAPNGPRRRVIDPSDADAIRSRRSTANRLLAIFKAALNYAHQEGRVQSKAGWEFVKPFRAVSAPGVRFLTDDEIGRLVHVCEPSLRQIVVAGVLTGMRYGEITRLRGFDFNPEVGTISVAISKSGKSRHIYLTDEGRAFFEQAVVARPGANIIFTRADGTGWGKSHQFRPLRDACAAARIDPAISFHILRHTYASRLALAGTPMPVIAAQLGHEGTRMTERHYAHLTPNYVADVVRASFSALGIVPASNVAAVTFANGKSR
jgi:integrase